MKVHEQVVAVTGAARGLGAAIAREAVDRGARGIVLLDLDADGVTAVAAELGGLGVAADVTVESDIQQAIRAAEERYGHIDVWISNAGIGGRSGIDTPDERWQLEWGVHVMSHVYAARAVVQGMVERGRGALVAVASGNGLTTNPFCLVYAVTKHAAVALSEWLAVHYARAGIEVSCVVPYGMATPMLLEGAAENPDTRAFGMPSLMPAEEAAAAVLDGIEQCRFLITPHPEVLRHFQNKAADYDRWIAGMARLQDKLHQEGDHR